MAKFLNFFLTEEVLLLLLLFCFKIFNYSYNLPSCFTYTRITSILFSVIRNA